MRLAVGAARGPAAERVDSACIDARFCRVRALWRPALVPDGVPQLKFRRRET